MTGRNDYAAAETVAKDIEARIPEGITGFAWELIATKAELDKTTGTWIIAPGIKVTFHSVLGSSTWKVSLSDAGAADRVIGQMLTALTAVEHVRAAEEACEARAREEKEWQRAWDINVKEFLSGLSELTRKHCITFDTEYESSRITLEPLAAGRNGEDWRWTCDYDTLEWERDE